MNAITPPKLMPPFQSTAASGIFPTEHTNAMTATSGPTIGPHSLARSRWSTRKNDCQNPAGTQERAHRLSRSDPFKASRAERVVEFEGKIGVREGASLNLEAGRNADITLRRREARIRRQSALQRLGQRNRSRRPLSG